MPLCACVDFLYGGRCHVMDIENGVFQHLETLRIAILICTQNLDLIPSTIPGIAFLNENLSC